MGKDWCGGGIYKDNWMHTVPHDTPNVNELETSDHNKLGSAFLNVLGIHSNDGGHSKRLLVQKEFKKRKWIPTKLRPECKGLVWS